MAFLRLSLLLFIASNLHAQENEHPWIETPRKAAHSFVHFQLEGHKNLERSALTMSINPGLDLEKRTELARKLLAVLDAKGLIVVYENIPDNPAYVDSLSGEPTYILFQQLPEVFLTKTNRGWLFSQETLDRIPDLYGQTFSFFVEFVLDKLPDWVHKKWMEFAIWQYVALFVWLLLGLVIRKFSEILLSRYLHSWALKTRSTWDDQIIKHAEKPAGLVILFSFYYISFSNLRFSVTINFYLDLALQFALSASVIWLIYKLINVLADYLSEITSKTESKLDDQLVPLIRKTLKVFVVILGLLALLQNAGINVASVLAGLGLGGLAVALAARDTLANFFGSITIFMDKPFQIGDWVEIDGRHGTVEEVGFRSTRIRTFENSVLAIPNATLANAFIHNYGLRQYRRLKMVLNLTYSTKAEQVEAFVEGIKAIIQANPHTRKDFYEVHFNSFGAHSLDVLVYAFFNVPDWSTELQQRHHLLLEILRLAGDIGVEFAFPTQTLHVDSFYDAEPRKVGKTMTAAELIQQVESYGPGGKNARPQGTQLQHEGKPLDFGVKS